MRSDGSTGAARRRRPAPASEQQFSPSLLHCAAFVGTFHDRISRNGLNCVKLAPEAFKIISDNSLIVLLFVCTGKYEQTLQEPFIIIIQTACRAPSAVLPEKTWSERGVCFLESPRSPSIPGEYSPFPTLRTAISR